MKRLTDTLLTLLALLFASPGGCASTSIEIEGYGTYRSDRDSQLDELHFTKSITGPDGSVTEITLDVNGASGNASDVEAARWQTVQKAIDKIPAVPLPIQ